MFQIHQTLQQDCIILDKLELCYLLLMNDANYPWFILVPARAGVSEIFQLKEADQGLLLQESTRLAAYIHRVFDAHKINIAALGNVVPQLHIHHIVRYQNDASWPKPVWGQQPSIGYSEDQVNEIRAVMQDL
jgi:diadenosine tetraphosphate (Ap4A) HIT family hydrolase